MKWPEINHKFYKIRNNCKKKKKKKKWQKNQKKIGGLCYSVIFLHFFPRNNGATSNLLCLALLLTAKQGCKPQISNLFSRFQIRAPCMSRAALKTGRSISCQMVRSCERRLDSSFVWRSSQFAADNPLTCACAYREERCAECNAQIGGHGKQLKASNIRRSYAKCSSGSCLSERLQSV